MINLENTTKGSQIFFTILKRYEICEIRFALHWCTAERKQNKISMYDHNHTSYRWPYEMNQKQMDCESINPRVTNASILRK